MGWSDRFLCVLGFFFVKEEEEEEKEVPGW